MSILFDKYKILYDTAIRYKKHMLYRIQALKEFGDVKAGDIGGYIEHERNLSQQSLAWVYDDAKVYENARVMRDATVRDTAVVNGRAEISTYATVKDQAQVSGTATIHGCATVGGASVVQDGVSVSGHAQVLDTAIVRNRAKILSYAIVRGSSQVCDYAIIGDNAQILDNATILNHAYILGNSIVKHNAMIFNDARVQGEGQVGHSMYIGTGIVSTNLFVDLEENIRCQTGLVPFNGKVIAYKQVNKDLTSFYNRNFQYAVGKLAIEVSPEYSNKSCTRGLHFSNANYWNEAAKKGDPLQTTFLVAEINLSDIITVQEGKIRCSKAKIIGSYNIKND